MQRPTAMTAMHHVPMRRMHDRMRARPIFVSGPSAQVRPSNLKDGGSLGPMPSSKEEVKVPPMLPSPNNSGHGLDTGSRPRQPQFLRSGCQCLSLAIYLQSSAVRTAKSAIGFRPSCDIARPGPSLLSRR